VVWRFWPLPPHRRLNQDHLFLPPSLSAPNCKAALLQIASALPQDSPSAALAEILGALLRTRGGRRSSRESPLRALVFLRGFGLI
jgi:hypothetical protein